MIQEFLSTYHTDKQYTNLQIGNYIFTDYQAIQPQSIVIFSCPFLENEDVFSSVDAIREQLYTLASGNWNVPIFDIGNIIPSENISDTFFAIQQVSEFILDKKAFPLFLGGSASLVFPLYQALEKYFALINFTAIEPQIHLPFEINDEISNENVLTKLINKETTSLLHYTNLGYQSYFTSYKIIDVLQNLNFDSYKLGDIAADLKEAEPVLRTSDLVLYNFNAISSHSKTFNTQNNFNGFSSREACALARYTGISLQLKAIIFSDFFIGNVSESTLAAQIIWYFIEGYNKQNNFQENNSHQVTYNVMLQDKELIFLQDTISQKWWIKIFLDHNKSQNIIIPSTENDYKQALQGDVPERFWKSLKKNL